jgi:DNA-binding MarR family transcriptional regulator
MTSRLQAEIKQGRPFDAPEGEALVGLLRTAALLDHALHEALKPHGLTLAQYNVLRILRGAGRAGLCGRDVGERLIARVPDVPRLLDRMEELGVLSRERDSADRRHVTARITPAGLRLLDDAAPAVGEVEQRWLGRLDADALRTLIAALDTIRAAG